jgi:hypothetical protein
LQQIGQQSLVKLKVALVFSQVSSLVSLGEYPPDLHRRAERMREGLEHKVALVAAVAGATQRVQRKGMARV